MRTHRQTIATSTLLRGLFVLGLSIVGLSACGSDETIDAPIDPNTGVPILPAPTSAIPILESAAGPGVTAKSAALTAVGGCDDIFEVLRKQAIVETVANVRSAFVSAWQSRQYCGQPHYADCGAMADAGAISPPTPGPEHSETNNQVVGVDEADLVKTDGNYVYLIIGGKVRILASWPAAQTKQLAELNVAGTPLKLFQHGDRLLVYSADGNGTTKECTYGYSCAPTGDGRPLTISVFDITDRTKPRLVRTLRTSARCSPRAASARRCIRWLPRQRANPSAISPTTSTSTSARPAASRSSTPTRRCSTPTCRRSCRRRRPTWCPRSSTRSTGPTARPRKTPTPGSTARAICRGRSARAIS